MEKSIRLLSIVPFPLFPLQSGGQNRTFGLFNELGKKHDVIVISPVTEAPNLSLSFSLFGSVLRPSFFRYFDFFSLPALIKYAKVSDVISIEQPFFGLMGLIISWLTKKPLVVNAHNIEYQRFKSLGVWWWIILKKYEAFVFRHADAVFFISELDRDIGVKAFKLNYEKSFVSPYGVSIPRKRKVDKNIFKKKYHIPEGHSVFLFFGKMDYLPNQHAVENIQKYVLPALINIGLTDFTILICGKGLPENLIDGSTKKHIKYIGFVEDLEEVILSSDLLLNPITSGGGVKTKVLEAIALNKAVVSTAEGALGINKQVCGEKLLVAKNNDWDAFAELCINAKEAPQTETPIAFFEKYSWEGIAKQYERDLSNLF